MKLKNLTTKKYFTIVKDLFLSMVAYSLPAVSLTFFIQPAISRQISADDYGQFLTLLSIIRLLCGVLGGSLSNLRLLRNQEYQQKGYKGDFNYLLLFSSLLSTGALLVILYFYGVRSVWEFALCVLTMLCIMTHDYFAVFFRVVIQYKKLVLNNVFVVLGYLVGLVIYMRFPIWQIVMLSGYIAGLIYIFFTSPFCREPIKKTPRFKESRKEYTQLSTSYLLKESTVYCDRLMIYPMMGGAQVSIYNAAAVAGKVIQLISSPLHHVLISYIVRWNGINRKLLNRIYLLLIPISVASYGFLYVVGRVLLPIMYPDYAQAAIPYLWIVLLALLANAITSQLNALLLRFDKTTIQIVLSFVRLVSYLICTIPLGMLFGLYGFCTGFLISSLIFFFFVVGRLTYVVYKLSKTPAEESSVEESATDATAES